MNDRVAGSTWLWTWKGKLWPVVLCGDNVPPKPFRESRINHFTVPAILLGKHIYIWVTITGLQDFDPNKDYFQGLPSPKSSSNAKTTTVDDDLEIQRHTAFVQDAMQYKDDGFWSNYIASKSAARKLDLEMKAKLRRTEESNDEVEFIGSKRKRKSDRKRETPRKQRADSKGYLPTPGLSPTKCDEYGVRQSIESQETKSQSDEGFGGSENTLFVQDSRRLSDAVVVGGDEQSDNDEIEAAKAKRIEKTRQENLQHIRDNLPRVDQCTIFVGPECTPFLCASVALDKCQFLADRSHFEHDLGLHIFLHPTIDISRERFQPIGEYLTRGDFAPKFTKATASDRLEDFFTPEQSDAVAQHLILIYHTAAKIRFEVVQEMCFRKLVVLEFLGQDTLLVVAKVARAAEKYGCKTENLMLNWLANQLSKQFWRRVESSYMTISRVMREDKELSKRVFAILADDPTIASERTDDDWE